MSPGVSILTNSLLQGTSVRDHCCPVNGRIGLKIFVYDKELHGERGGVDLNADCRFRHVLERSFYRSCPSPLSRKSN